MAEVQDTKVITGLVRLSFESVWEKSGMPEDTEDKLRYQTTLLIPKSDTKTIKAIKAAIEIAKAQWLTKSGAKKIPADFDEPLKDGDDTEYEDYKGHFHIRAKSTRMPGILDRFKQPITIANRDEVYSGCFCLAHISFFPYPKPYKGVGVNLGNLMKIKDGPRLSGGMSADEAFEEIDADLYLNDEDTNTDEDENFD